MCPLELIYSIKAFKKWSIEGKRKLKKFRESSRIVRSGSFWDVKSWQELDEAVAFLTLMNKRHMLYYRGQKKSTRRCLPMLFRRQWRVRGEGRNSELCWLNRFEYYRLLHRKLCMAVNKAVQEIGTPHEYIIHHVPGATASILQHHEL